MRNVEVITPQNVAIRFRLASLGSRISAYLIDLVMIAIFYVFMFFLVFLPLADVSGNIFTIVLVASAVFLASFYHLLMEMFNNGQSLGKQAMSIRVIDENGSTPEFFQLFMRWLLRLVDISISSGGIAILSIALTDKGQRLGDLLGKTIVVDLHNPQTESLANVSPRAERPKPKPTPETVQPDEPVSRLENNLRPDEPAVAEPVAAPLTDEQPADTSAPSEAKTRLVYPEVANLTEADIRKMDALYRKVRNGTYDIEVKRQMLTRMKNALEKKMGTFSKEDTITSFLKQVFADFHAHQKEQESRGGW